ncbi:MAG TPA: hypothetical protein VFR35_06765 [Actinoplanes sp.]|nr:hypothetical protein [Actinoplanes sp.]
MTTVIHQPRVAWDGAQAFVRITRSPYYEAFADHVWERLGSEMFRALEETRDRVLDNLVRTGGDRYVTDVEAGKWRIRFEDLLRTRPDLTGTLIDLTAMVPRA